MGTLSERVAIVTGGGRGLGEAVAKLFAAEGATVIVNDLGVSLGGQAEGSSPAEQVVAAITEAGGTAYADTTDITDFQAVAELVEGTVTRYGGLHIVANVAGILRDRMIFNMTEQEWDEVINVHLKGHFNLTRHAAHYWRTVNDPSGDFRLINFTSGSGLHGGPGQPNYAAAKMGIVGLTFNCANALAKYGVTANAIAPAALTRMTANTPSERRSAQWEDDEQWLPENVVPIVGYLAGRQSGWCTGRVISTRGYQVALYSNPEVLCTLQAPAGGWDLDVLGKAVEREFKPCIERNPLRDPVAQAAWVAEHAEIIQC
jgi:NAD(P)-dependent dehydrogenase (short-subunit alcohol dehydrogenase family)